MFYEFLQISIFFSFLVSEKNACKVEFQIMKVYIENCDLGEKSIIKVNQIISQFKSQLI